MAELNEYFESILKQDNCSVVVCDNNHDIIYMNPAAEMNYAKSGGKELVGKSIFFCHNQRSQDLIKQVVAWFAESAEHNKVHTFYNKKQNKDVYMIALRNSSNELIGYYEKHEFRNIDPTPLYEMK